MKKSSKRKNIQNLLTLVKLLNEIKEMNSNLDNLETDEERNRMLEYIKKVNLSIKGMGAECPQSNTLIIKKY